MTIAASWIRKVHNCEELVFIADKSTLRLQNTEEYIIRANS